MPPRKRPSAAEQEPLPIERFVVVAVWSAATVQSSELRAAHIAAVHASIGPTTLPGDQGPGWRRAARVQEDEAQAPPGPTQQPGSHTACSL
ncbi:hypothetical protein HaLaN_32004 [Haematococcus lacustris]|uniref:Uncharacterized protein n=1 Tax=Haematococcus lacustris TaxID=44745 RepID=A0A6A0AIZ7_HAELA|nr:hypothetical protein HaLaN_32004 [Haematococcus lacustris]